MEKKPKKNQNIPSTNINNSNNNNPITGEDQKLISKIDEYNINQLLLNILNRLIIKSESPKTNSQNPSTKDSSINSNIIQSNRNNTNDYDETTLNQLITKLKDNYPNFFYKTLPPNPDFGILFTDMESLNKEYANKSEFKESDGFSLLGYFEEEIRTFFRKHPFLLKNNYNTEENNNNNKELIEKKIIQITKITEENSLLLNDIFNNFKNVHSKEKQKYIDYINLQHSKINEVLEDIKNYAFNSLNSEQWYKSYEKLKERLIEDQKNKESEIRYNREVLNKYISQGEEMTSLLNEYKKYCNMIDCLKIK